jgi:hypothetical protein
VAAATWTGVCCTVVLWGWLGPVSAIVVIAMLSALAVWSLAPDSQDPSLRAVVRVGLLSGARVVAAVGLVVAFGLSGAVLVVVAVATCPLVRARLGWTRDRPASPAPDVASEAHDEESPLPGHTPASLDDVALCQAWRRSFLLLQRTSRIDGLLAVASLRQEYLDELARRHPAGIDRWLASGARAAGDPLPFLDEPEEEIDGREAG